MKRQLMALTLGALSLSAVQVFSAEEDNNAYREGYGLILDQQWEQARDYFTQFQSRWSDSAWADDAAFWRCYAIEQQSTDGEAQFNCYENFLADHPQSSWVSDARSKLMVVGSRLASRGSPRFFERMDLSDLDGDWDFEFEFDGDEIEESIAEVMEQAERELQRVQRIRDNRGVRVIPPLSSLPDIEEIVDPEELRRYMAQMRDEIGNMELDVNNRRISVRSLGRNTVDDELLIIISALRDDDRASNILLQRLDDAEDPALRGRLVLLLEDIRGEEITSRLIDIVQNDESESVRNNALIVLLDRDEEMSHDLLLDIARDNTYPLSLRVEVIDNLEDWDEGEALEVLENIMTGETEPALIAEAADALADIGSPEALSLLIDQYENQENPQLRLLILGEIADVRSPEVMNLLSDIAISAEDDDLAVIAIEGIADREDNIATAALEHIFLNTMNQQRQLAAISGIGDTETAQAVEVLAQIVMATSEPRLLAAAALALGDTRRESAVPIVRDIYLNSDDAGVQRAAIRALRRLDRYPSAADAMLEVLERRLSEQEAL